MKKNVLILVITFLSLIQAFTQTSVPQAVASAFQAKFPSTQPVQWEEEDKGIYEADFKLNKHKTSASFDASGTWLSTETEIKKNALPDAVRQGIGKAFPDYEVDEAEKIETPDGLAYEVELEKEEGGKDIEVEALFSAEGKLLKQSKEEEDGEVD